MNHRQKDVFRYLQSHSERWVLSNELAEFCRISTRSVRNNISKIKDEMPGAILSSSQGYRFANSEQTAVPSSEAESRETQIFLLLLKKSDLGINIFDLADKLFISESTVRTDLQKLRKKFADSGLKIKTKGNEVFLNGGERAKRKYMVSLLYGEGDFKNQLKVSVQNMIGFISMSELEATIQGQLKKKNIKISTYTLYNIALHFAIGMARIREGHAIKATGKVGRIASTPAYELSVDVSDAISERYQVQFSELEKEYFSLLFIGIQNDIQEEKMLSNYVQSDVKEALKSVLASVEETYHIDLRSHDFFVKLAVHIQSLYYRSQFDSYARNSSLQDIKASYPLIYDISVYIASMIQERLDIDFNDDEISFIALHLGALLESQQKMDQPIRVALIAENYHSIDQVIKDKLQTALGKHVSIIDEAAYKEEYDVLITTSRRVVSKQAGSVFINPLPTNSDLVRIQNRIISIQKQVQDREIYRYIDRFILRELYFNQTDPVYLTPAEIRQQMVARLVRHHYADKDYLESVEKREQMSPTSFPSGVAIPHSVVLNANKSGVSIMTMQESIQWAYYPVRLVVMVTVNPQEAQIYNVFFEKFIEILSDPVNVQLLSEAEGFESFKMRLKTLVSDSSSTVE
ncbi:hypothetical protein ACX51_14690 [Lacticaseibacillus paracasei]|uniref:PTS system EIIA component n=1 Tax=Lacticaseibacillus paracasei TaxID=1597 RepID=A0ABD6VX55_LACPA|nr:BglG family transcription antiterminator [Lacticaseibacillus paracasei]POE39158.1 hypothetical protein ACX51_14690 [Lacticaseibacillus paracasei]